MTVTEIAYQEILSFIETAMESEIWQEPAILEFDEGTKGARFKIYRKNHLPGPSHYLDVEQGIARTLIKEGFIAYDRHSKATKVLSKGKDYLCGKPLAPDEYYATLIDLSDEQQVLIQMIFDHVCHVGVWPQYYEIGRKLYPLDIEALAKSLPQNYINSGGAIDANYYRGEVGNQAVLSIPAVHRCENSQLVIQNFLLLLKFCLEQSADNSKLVPRISSDDLKQSLGFSDKECLIMLSLLESEGDVTAGGSTSPDRIVWHRDISLYIRRYHGVTSIEEYIARRPRRQFHSQPETNQLLGTYHIETPTEEEQDIMTDGPLRLFYSYSHEDEDLRKELEKHLKLLQRSGAISEWHDRKITAGTEWAGTITAELEQADIILLLISSDFVASEYCYDVEMARALQKHAAGEARVIPIVVRSVDWSGAPFSKLQMLPQDAKAIKSWDDRDEAWTSVTKGIRNSIKEWLAQPQKAINPLSLGPVTQHKDSDSWEKILLFADAGSFRQAERLGRSLLPIASSFSASQVIAILGMTALNNQIWDAVNIPKILDIIFEHTQQHLPYTAKAWGRLIQFITGQGQHDRYVALGQKVKSAHQDLAEKDLG